MISSSQHCIVLVSGGLDSCVCAAIAKQHYKRLSFLHLNYGQRTEARELKAFHAIADHYSVTDRLVVDISFLSQIGGSALVDTQLDIHDANLNATTIPNTYVPFRNTHIIAIAVSWAEVIGAGHILIGAVNEDSSGYPDCRPEYYNAYNALIKVGTKNDYDILIETPLIEKSKSEIVSLGSSLEAPLDASWSCYRESNIACGRCDSCALRLRGFEQAEMIDPIPYAAT